jgi:hypothetical protein
VTYVANAATLSTFAEHGAEGARGFPFGTYVDYILDDKVRRSLPCRLIFTVVSLMIIIIITIVMTASSSPYPSFPLPRRAPNRDQCSF